MIFARIHLMRDLEVEANLNSDWIYSDIQNWPHCVVNLFYDYLKFYADYQTNKVDPGQYS